MLAAATDNKTISSTTTLKSLPSCYLQLLYPQSHNIIPFSEFFTSSQNLQDHEEEQQKEKDDDDIEDDSDDDLDCSGGGGDGDDDDDDDAPPPA